jgi:hypothetical protein
MSLPHTFPTLRRQARALARMPIIPGIAAVTLLALLAGCSGGHTATPLVRSADPDVQRCREECKLLNTQCQQRQENRERGCAERLTSQADYDQCRRRGASNCQAAYTCLGPDMSICQREYTPCLSACGQSGEPRQAAAAGTGAPAKADQTTETPPKADQTETPPKTDTTETAPKAAPKADKRETPPKANKTGGAAG